MSERDGDAFLARWSRRKALVRQGRDPLPEPPPPAAPIAAPLEAARPLPAGEVPSADTAPERPPAPTLDDVARLDKTSDFQRFVAPDVEPQVRNAALKKLFTDPHFNVMDGLDVYIDDYGKPDPMPPSMLRELAQSRALGLFDDDEDAAAATPVRQVDASAERADPDGAAQPASATSAPTDSRAEIRPNDPDPAVRLQQDDAAGPSGVGAGAGPDAGRER